MSLGIHNGSAPNWAKVPNYTLEACYLFKNTQETAAKKSKK